MQGARRLREVGVRCEAGRCWLLWMIVMRLRILVSYRMTWSFGSACRAGAKRTLCTFLSVNRKRTARRDPSRSTPRRVRRGSGRCPALFSSRTSSPRARYTDYYSLPPRSRPPHDRRRRSGATRTVFSPASAFGLTPDDPVLSPSNRQTSPPKNSKTTRKAPKPQPTDAAS